MWQFGKGEEDAFKTIFMMMMDAVSIESDYYTSRNLHGILHDAVHRADADWMPSVLDIVRIFVNYGAYIGSIVLRSHCSSS